MPNFMDLRERFHEFTRFHEECLKGNDYVIQVQIIPHGSNKPNYYCFGYEDEDEQDNRNKETHKALSGRKCTSIETNFQLANKIVSIFGMYKNPKLQTIQNLSKS